MTQITARQADEALKTFWDHLFTKAEHRVQIDSEDAKRALFAAIEAAAATRPVTMPPTFGAAKLCKSGEDEAARPVPQAGEVSERLRDLASDFGRICAGDQTLEAVAMQTCGEAADMLTAQAAALAAKDAEIERLKAELRCAYAMPAAIAEIERAALAPAGKEQS